MFYLRKDSFINFFINNHRMEIKASDLKGIKTPEQAAKLEEIAELFEDKEMALREFSYHVVNGVIVSPNGTKITLERFYEVLKRNYKPIEPYTIEQLRKPRIEAENAYLNKRIGGFIRSFGHRRPLTLEDYDRGFPNSN